LENATKHENQKKKFFLFNKNLERAIQAVAIREVLEQYFIYEIIYADQFLRCYCYIWAHLIRHLKMLIVYHHQMKQHIFFCKTNHCQCTLNYIYTIVKLDRTII